MTRKSFDVRQSTIGVYRGVKTCETFSVFFVMLARGSVRLLFDALLLFCFPLCYVNRKFHRFLHREL